ncbi:unnamed protein product [Cylicocyclus nassatus]|uniref:Transmembrane protein 209 n=1 Tax=Cylicocyclus nassatus TaxID=53992 RepID=A0AA36GYP2_CYLNA|nr:unnamed protein product [Cylicocyclus nassatus]
MRELHLTPRNHAQNQETPAKFSPEAQIEAKRKVASVNRSTRLKSSLLPWAVALAVICIEIFTFRSSLGSFFFGDYLPHSVVVFFEYAFFVYLLSVILWITYQIVNTKSHTTLPANFGMILPSPLSHPVNKAATKSPALDSSSRADTSWVEDHHFGTMSEAPLPQSRQSQISPNRSVLNDSSHLLNLSSGSFGNTSIRGYSSNVVVPKSSPFNKSIDSIHTREQLEHLLAKDSPSHMDSSSMRSSSFTYFNVLDIGAPEERRGYQLSEPLKAGDSKENIVVKMGPGSRLMLSPASSEGDGQDELTRLRYTLQHARHSPRKGPGILRRSESVERRRRSLSMSSPERSLLPNIPLPVPTEIDAKSSSLREVDLVRGEQRLRAWIVNTILEPLDRRIKETNAKLEKEHSSPPLKIGVSSVDALQSAMITRTELLDTMLPYILPFLSVHNNQNYVVGRISELAADKFMMDYNWNSGGREPVQEKVSLGRGVRRPWSDQNPTDAMLIFSLFSAYMDSQLTSNPLVGSCRLAQPFSAVYTLKTPQRPTAVHLAAESFYLHMSNISPPHFDFVFNDADGSPTRAVIPRGARNLFAALLSFINHVKVHNGGRLDRMSIGPTGLNIACVLE